MQGPQTTTTPGAAGRVFVEHSIANEKPASAGQDWCSDPPQKMGRFDSPLPSSPLPSAPSSLAPSPRPGGRGMRGPRASGDGGRPPPVARDPAPENPGNPPHALDYSGFRWRGRHGLE